VLASTNCKCSKLGIKRVHELQEELLIKEQIVVIHSNCILIFCEFEETVVFLKPEEPMQAGRLIRRAVKEQTVSSLISRLQSSKTSLSLMLNTLTWWGLIRLS